MYLKVPIPPFVKCQKLCQRLSSVNPRKAAESCLSFLLFAKVILNRIFQPQDWSQAHPDVPPPLAPLRAFKYTSAGGSRGGEPSTENGAMVGCGSNSPKFGQLQKGTPICIAHPTSSNSLSEPWLNSRRRVGRGWSLAWYDLVPSKGDLLQTCRHTETSNRSCLYVDYCGLIL